MGSPLSLYEHPAAEACENLVMAPKRIRWRSIRTVPLATRESKVHTSDLARPYSRGATLSEFLANLPGQLAARDLLELASAVVAARRRKCPVLLMFGGAVVKCGLGPMMNQWLDRGILSCLATNGAGAIHDFELALAGQTSEDVARGLADGTFGMAEETGRMMNRAARRAARRREGYGAVLARMISHGRFPYKQYSVLGCAAKNHVPLTVHIGIGTDVVHQHPSADGAAIGAASFRDFQTLTEQVAALQDGVLLHFGSAVILPEVFLKALTVARNLGHKVDRFTAANFDMIRHYRPTQNVLLRPTQKGGKAYNFTGHHEIMFPLLTAAVFEKLASE